MLQIDYSTMSTIYKVSLVGKACVRTEWPIGLMLISSFRRSMKWHGIFPLSPRWGTAVPLRIFSHHLPHRYLLRHIFCPNIFGLVKDDKSEKGTRSSPALLPPQLARLSVCSCYIPVLSVVVVRNFFLLNYNERFKLLEIPQTYPNWKSYSPEEPSSFPTRICALSFTYKWERY